MAKIALGLGHDLRGGKTGQDDERNAVFAIKREIIYFLSHLFGPYERFFFVD